MKEAKEKFIKTAKECNFRLFGSFKNVHGEEFVIYNWSNMPLFFVTGDELDWETGYRFDEICGTLGFDFSLSGDERKEILSVIYKFRSRDAKKKIEKMIGKTLPDNFLDLLNELTLREQKILNHRFGISDGLAHTLEETGKIFDVTRERVRQIESKAIEKLKTLT